MIILYLIAIVTANYLVYKFGPGVTIINAFIFIGLNLTTRDYLHDQWRGRNLKRNMFLLIAAGSVLSLFFNAGRVALASFVAFAVSEGVDALVYQALHKYPKWLQMNGSNIPSALVDSILFPTLAFGVLLPGIIAGQFLAKVFGGFVWVVVLTQARRFSLPLTA